MVKGAPEFGSFPDQAWEEMPEARQPSEGQMGDKIGRAVAHSLNDDEELAEYLADFYDELDRAKEFLKKNYRLSSPIETMRLPELEPDPIAGEESTK